MEEKIIDIFGTKYTLKYVDCPSSNTQEELDKGYYNEGFCSPTKRIIEVATKTKDGEAIPPYDLQKNTWHEVVHAILAEGQYMACNNDEPLVEWLTRNIVNILSQHVI